MYGQHRSLTGYLIAAIREKALDFKISLITDGEGCSRPQYF